MLTPGTVELYVAGGQFAGGCKTADGDGETVGGLVAEWIEVSVGGAEAIVACRVVGVAGSQIDVSGTRGKRWRQGQRASNGAGLQPNLCALTTEDSIGCIGGNLRMAS